MNESILRLRETITQLEKREHHLQNQADQCIVSARGKSKKKDKRGQRNDHLELEYFLFFYHLLQILSVQCRQMLYYDIFIQIRITIEFPILHHNILCF